MKGWPPKGWQGSGAVSSANREAAIEKIGIDVHSVSTLCVCVLTEQGRNGPSCRPMIGRGATLARVMHDPSGPVAPWTVAARGLLSAGRGLSGWRGSRAGLTTAPSSFSLPPQSGHCGDVDAERAAHEVGPPVVGRSLLGGEPLDDLRPVAWRPGRSRFGRAEGDHLAA